MGRPATKTTSKPVVKKAVETAKVIENEVETLETEDEIIEDIPMSEEIKIENLNMDEKITIRNIANWMVGFNKIESMGEVNINPNGSVRITRAEAIAQFENGNKLICGTGNGKHGTIYIDDKLTRDYLEYKGFLINKDFVKKIFEIKGIGDFSNKIADTFVTRAEKILLINIIRECSFNDFNKVRECENHCGINV
jgi:hypothetical protein